MQSHLTVSVMYGKHAMFYLNTLLYESVDIFSFGSFKLEIKLEKMRVIAIVLVLTKRYSDDNDQNIWLHLSLI